MEPIGSLSCPQELASNPYPRPNESSSQTHVCHVCYSAPSISLDFVALNVKVLKLLVLQFSTALCNFVEAVMVLVTVYELNV
jgi:hypothetical protein